MISLYFFLKEIRLNEIIKLFMNKSGQIKHFLLYTNHNDTHLLITEIIIKYLSLNIYLIRII